jgi:signal transduction histidine kinase
MRHGVTIDGREDARAAPGGRVLIAADEGAEALLRTTLDALSAHIAVLDDTGTVLAVNAAWRRFAEDNGYRGSNYGVGENYLDVCRRSAEVSEEAALTAGALHEIIAGQRTTFRMEYPCEAHDGLRWFQLRVTCPEPAPLRRIVIAHEDITEVKRSQEALARLSARIMQLQDDERRRIARELHDTTAQNLLAITLSAARLFNGRRGQGEATAAIASEIFDLAEQSLQEVRTLSYLLHPPLLDEVGLQAALRWLAKGFGERSGIATEARIDDLKVPPPPDVATAIFRVAQEALVNIHRHSGSAWARLSLRQRGAWIELRVEDAGRGLDASGGAAAEAVGVGISGMRVRVAQLGGSLELLPRRPGLLVRALFPAPAQAAAVGHAPSGEARQ